MNGLKGIIISKTGIDISTSPLGPASEFMKKGLSGKYILVFTCPNGQAGFLSSVHNSYIKKMAQISRNMQTMQQHYIENGFSNH